VRAGVTLVYVRFFSGFGIEFEKDEMERVHDYITRAHSRGIKVAAVVALGTLTSETLLSERERRAELAAVQFRRAHICAGPGRASVERRTRPCRPPGSAAMLQFGKFSALH